MDTCTQCGLVRSPGRKNNSWNRHIRNCGVSSLCSKCQRTFTASSLAIHTPKCHGQQLELKEPLQAPLNLLKIFLISALDSWKHLMDSAPEYEVLLKCGRKSATKGSLWYFESFFPKEM